MLSTTVFFLFWSIRAVLSCVLFSPVFYCSLLLKAVPSSPLHSSLLFYSPLSSCPLPSPFRLATSPLLSSPLLSSLSSPPLLPICPDLSVLGLYCISRLVQMLQDYREILARIPAILSPLMEPFISRVEAALSPGLTTLCWSTINTDTCMDGRTVDRWMDSLIKR